MADQYPTSALILDEPPPDAQPGHAALVAKFRKRLAGLESPLDRLAPEELEEIRNEFRRIAEVAGEPLPLAGTVAKPTAK
jgi:hypothetical protein